MASLEQLQQLRNASDLDDKSSTSTSSSDESDDAPLASLRIAKPVKPKKKKSAPVKLKLTISNKKKLPLHNKKKPPPTPTVIESDVVVEAIVVEGDSDTPPDVVVEAEPVTSNEKVTPSTSSSATTPLKKRTIIRPVKIPPIPSPGLRFPHVNAAVLNNIRVENSSNGGSDKNASSQSGDGLMAPADLFEHHLKLAGYSQSRTHRGSSVQRQVGDMFDSDVTLALNFPSIVPKALLNGGLDSKENGEPDTLMEENALLDVIRRGLQDVNANGTTSVSSRKRKRPLRFQDMIPVSLTLEWPEEYIQARKTYVAKVKQREATIVEAQEAFLEDLTIPEIPPIPVPPKPPKITDLTKFGVTDEYPLYPPKCQEMVKHLDRRCFHATDGRYFGLMSNSISDPHFVGPLAPGWGGLTISAVTGLATTQTGNSGAGSASLASTVYGTTPKEARKDQEAVKTNKIEATTKKPIESPKKPKKLPSSSKQPSKTSSKTPKDGFSSSSKLKQLMEKGGEDAEDMRNCIIRAAVYASRTSRHGRPFVGSDGNKYPDVSKAFAAHGSIRPCNRCKNNKQGAYHCRLRRKHKELDYDGGDSPGKLAPLFAEELENLIIQA